MSMILKNVEQLLPVNEHLDRLLEHLSYPMHQQSKEMLGTCRILVGSENYVQEIITIIIINKHRTTQVDLR